MNMGRCSHFVPIVVLLAISLLSISPSHASSDDAEVGSLGASGPSLHELARFVPGFRASPGEMPAADFDGDGVSDLVMLGQGDNSTIVQIVGQGPALAWGIKQTLVLPTDETFQSEPIVTAVNATAGGHLIVARSGRIYVYAGWPLSLAKTITQSQWGQIRSIRAGDIDANGSIEIVSILDSYPDTLDVRSLATGAALWSRQLTSYGGQGLALAQLDNDPALEILSGETDGHVVDGATQATEWRYKDGFGSILLTGKFSPSGARFAGIGQRLIMFQGSPWSPLWDEPTNTNVATAFDLDGDGIQEILMQNNWGGTQGVAIFDVQSRIYRQAIGSIGAAGIAAGKFTSSGVPQIALSSRALESFPANLQILDASSGDEQFSILGRAPGSYTTTLAKAVIPGNATLVSASTSGYGADMPARLIGMDALSGSLRWQSPAFPYGHPLYGATISPLHAAKLNGETGYSVVFAAKSLYSGASVTAIGADTGSIQWSFPLIDPENDFSYTTINTTLPVDRDGDGNADSILLCTSETRLYEYSLSSHQQLWKSVAMPGGTCNGLVLAESGGARFVIAAVPLSLRAYDLDTRLLSWSLPMVSRGISTISHGVEGPEIAVFDGNEIHFIRAATQEILRTVVVPVPDQIVALTQPEGASIHQLLLTSRDRLFVVDGVDGAIQGESGAMGYQERIGNQLPAIRIGPDHYLVGTGGGAGIFVNQLVTHTDQIFIGTFD